MKKTFLTSVSFLLFAVLLLQIIAPTFVLADTITDQMPSSSCTSNSPTNGTGGIVNPLKINSIECFIVVALGFVVDLLAVAAVCYIMWAGFLFVKAQGNPEELKTAKQALLHALIGTAIVLGAWGLATVIANTVNKVTNNDVSLKVPKP